MKCVIRVFTAVRCLLRSILGSFLRALQMLTLGEACRANAAFLLDNDALEFLFEALHHITSASANAVSSTVATSEPSLWHTQQAPVPIS